LLSLIAADSDDEQALAAITVAGAPIVGLLGAGVGAIQGTWVEQELTSSCGRAQEPRADELAATTRSVERDGFMFGLGFGGGSRGLERSDESEGTTILNSRIGYVVRRDLVLNWETTSSELSRSSLTYTANALGITWFPQNTDTFVRGGVGWGTRSSAWTFWGGSNSRTGLAVLIAAGYEWRVATRYTLGPHIEFSWMNLDRDVNTLGVALDLNRY
jgi:hypothetical protein